MKLASRVTIHAGVSARVYLLMALGAVALGLAACSNQAIGRKCVTNAPPDAGANGETTIISSPSLQCPSRICIQPSPMGPVANAADEGAMCTALCNTDDDCTDTDPGTPCMKGFVCAWPTTAGPFCCQKMCVCHDFVTVPKGGFLEPATCQQAGGSCQNVH
jgi:hypothetical protein